MCIGRLCRRLCRGGLQVSQDENGGRERTLVPPQAEGDAPDRGYKDTHYLLHLPLHPDVPR